jgi:thiol-disulfide isomerase/thioredoxin
MPKAAASHVEAAGAVPLDTTLGAPEWTWVNFWAAWCGPCKEEMPRLRQWSERLAREAAPVRLVFVSLDDDARQLEAFLNAQPADGVRSSLWLPEGPTRSLWLRNLRMDAAPELPEHALVDPAGRVRCFIEGAVEDGDYAAIATLVGHAPQAQPIRP